MENAGKVSEIASYMGTEIIKYARNARLTTAWQVTNAWKTGCLDVESSKTNLAKNAINPSMKSMGAAFFTIARNITTLAAKLVIVDTISPKMESVKKLRKAVFDIRRATAQIVILHLSSRVLDAWSTAARSWRILPVLSVQNPMRLWMENASCRIAWLVNRENAKYANKITTMWREPAWSQPQSWSLIDKSPTIGKIKYFFCQ